ncbi:hypothetical protein V1525DRAFT_395974 [Lipomyces kononenkoae]|uniref:Uncharacterized protein n=1 Tax=Lipomyces kononenkoae TaxID=34357 RepID=A0ACC3T805_LIPKO
MANYGTLPPINIAGPTPTSVQQQTSNNMYYSSSGIPHRQQQQQQQHHRQHQLLQHSRNESQQNVLPPPSASQQSQPPSSVPHSLSSLIHPAHHSVQTPSSTSQHRAVAGLSSAPESNIPALTSPVSSVSAASSPAQPFQFSVTGRDTSDQSPGANPTSSANDDHKRSRACDHCRALKVRCVPHDETEPSGTCHRCYKSSRQCVFTVNPRKRQKRTDTRVADLEKKLDELTARLAATKGQQGEHTRAKREILTPEMTHAAQPSRNGQQVLQTESEEQSQNIPPLHLPVKANSYPTPPMLHQQQPTTQADFSSISGLAELASLRPDELSAYYRTYSSPLRQSADVLGLRFVQPQHIEEVFRRYDVREELAQKVFDYFANDMLPHFPFLYFPPNMVFREVLMSKPMTSLAIFAQSIAKTKDTLDLASQLVAELYRIVSEQVFVVGNKTLDLIQCLMIMCAWYNPPEIYECNKVTIFTNCAITLARELGLHKPPRSRSQHKVDTIFRALQPVDTQSLECRRTWLGLYYASCVLSMHFRDTNPVRWSPYLDQCCEVLDIKDGVPSDHTLVRLARLHQIIENIADIFHPSDDSEPTDINDKRLAHMIRIFERNLCDWKNELTLGSKSDLVLLTSYHGAQIYLHEVGLHNKTNRGDFTVPFTEESIKPDLPVITPYHAEAIVWCIASCHELIDLFCSSDIPMLSFVPVHILGRVTYACTILLKIGMTVIKTNSLTSVCSLNMVRPDYYLGRTYQKVATILVGEGPASLVAMKFKYILGKLYLWFHSQKISNQSAESGNSSRNATPQRSIQSFGSNTDTDRASVSFRTVPEFESKLVSSINSTDASTLEMLSSVAVQEQQTNDGRSQGVVPSVPSIVAYSSDEEIRMPGTNMTVYEHIREEHLQEQRQQQLRRDSNSNATAVNGPDTVLATKTGSGSYLSAPVPGLIDTDTSVLNDVCAPPAGLDLSQLLVDDAFWIDVFYKNNGQMPNIEMPAA